MKDIKKSFLKAKKLMDETKARIDNQIDREITKPQEDWNDEDINNFWNLNHYYEKKYHLYLITKIYEKYLNELFNTAEKIMINNNPLIKEIFTPRVKILCQEKLIEICLKYV